MSQNPGNQQPNGAQGDDEFSNAPQEDPSPELLAAAAVAAAQPPAAATPQTQQQASSSQQPPPPPTTLSAEAENRLLDRLLSSLQTMGIPSSDLRLQPLPYPNQKLSQNKKLKKTHGPTGKTHGPKMDPTVVGTGTLETGSIQTGIKDTGINLPGSLIIQKTETDRTCRTWTSQPSMGTKKTLRRTRTSSRI